MNIRLNPIKIIIISTLSIIILTGNISAFEETIRINGLNGDYTTSDELSKAINSTQGSNSLDRYLENIQTYTQNREDLQLYFLGKNGELKNYTIMDRNMGADETYNQNFSNANSQSFGYHYQWGNNYGFEPCNELGCTSFPGGENISENRLYYRVRSVFTKGNFANNIWNQGFRLPRDLDECGCDCGTMGFQYLPLSEAVRTQLFENFRGGFGDSLTTNGNSTLNRWGFETSRYCDSNTGNIIKDSWTSSRQGPCPNGYHIPSLAERNDIIETRETAKNWTPLGANDKTPEKIEAFQNASYGAQLASDLLLPPAGIRSTYSGEHIYKGVIGGYRSSSPTYFGSNLGNVTDYTNGSRLLVFDQFYIKADGGDGHSVCGYYDEAGHTTRGCYNAGSRFDGESVRCIKNSNDITTKIYPNGGTNAIIGIDGHRITTLSTPSRNGCTFGGRYTEPDFSEYSLISLGSEIYDDAALYARWIGENCGRTNTQQQNCAFLPANAYWTNSKFTQTRNGNSWAPISHENIYTSDSNIECSFQCNTNYYRNYNTQECVFNGNGGGNSDTYKCTDLPENATANNSKVPEDSNKKYSYNTNINEICTFQCNNNYIRNNSFEKCVARGQEQNCTSLPANAYWINSKFIQTWNGTSRTPISHENTYSSDSNIECSFLCNTNYYRNTSSKICEYKNSGGGGGGGGGRSSKNSNHIYLSTNRKSPSTNQFINLTIETDDDYSGKLYFSVKYKSSSSSSRANISNPSSSSYFSSYSDEWEDGYYKMTSNDDGEVTLKNLVKFKKSGYYRIYIEDKYGNNNYIQFNIDSNSSDNNPYLEISASPSNPDTYEWVKLAINTDNDYTGKIKFSKLQYRSNSSSSWSTISSTSSTYISEYSDEWEDGYYKMTSNDDGEVTLKKVIKFKKSGHYKILVEDTDGNEDDVEINVGSSSSSSNNNNINISISPNNPYTYERINLTIKTSEDYNDKLYFNAEYKNPSSNDRYSISNTSAYFLDYSDDWKNGYYKMESSDNNKITLNNLIKFKIYGFYKIYIEDVYGNSNIFQFYVNSGTTQEYGNTNNGSDNSDTIENIINNLINGGTNNENSYSNKNMESGESEATKNATYISRSCKPYTIYYVAPLNAYTSPDLKKIEYFVNIDYLIRYIDSKNPKNSECNIGNGWISSPYTDKYTGTDYVTAPNGKVYFIDGQNGSFTSSQLTTAKSFQTIDEIKTYIKNHNPLSKIN